MYDVLASLFDIKEGDRIWLSSDITKIALMSKRKIGRFEPEEILHAFQDMVGDGGTLMLPTFCFDFSNNGRYDYRNSKGTTGVLGNIALDCSGFKRTKHPLHSFAVWGKDRDLICDMENKHSFGEDSPFRYCRDNNVKQAMLNTDYRHAMTFIHYVETACDVPYRFRKTFTGIYVKEDGSEEEREYDYAARRLDIGSEERFNRIGLILEENGIARSLKYDGCECHYVYLGDSYEIIKKDILFDQCRNIYDFSVPREQLFKEPGDI